MPEEYSITVTILVTAILTWIGHVIVSILQRRSDKDKALETEKREAYTSLLSLLYDILASIKNKDIEKHMPDYQKSFFSLVRDMTVYASDEVLRLFIELKNQQENAKPNTVLTTFANLILAVRRDLGHNTSITQKEILSTFITDVNELNIN